MTPSDEALPQCPYSPDGDHEWIEDVFDPPFECKWCMATARRSVEVPR